jgi:2-polyprenyl-3-methyl-5-hydroxy-6-metoxy-1,4-benzoquinol methylase
VIEGWTNDAWEALADRFVDGHYASLRGRVRTHVIHEHLRAALPSPPLDVVDVGGGAGNQSIPLARLGYAVTIVDPSASMLERAEQQLANEDTAVAHRVRLVEVQARTPLKRSTVKSSEASSATACSCTSTTPRRFSTRCAD